MGKYFKEEETSNHIKRFKTSDTQEKTLRFAQVSRVISKLDYFLDFTKTTLLKVLFKAPALLKVKPEIVTQLKNEFDAITRAQKTVATSTLSKISTLEEEIKTAQDRKDLLGKEIHGAPPDAARNKKVDEIRKIIAYLEKKNQELDSLKKDYADIEKNAKSEINAKIVEFNRVNDLTDPMSWNQDLANPKIEFLLGVPVSKRGTGVVMSRGRQKQQINIFNFLNQVRRGAGRAAFDGILTERYTALLESIGFFDKKYKFKVLKGDEWVDIKYSMGDLFEEINKGGFNRTTQKPLNDEVKAKIIADFEKFIEESDKIERGWLSPIVRSIISSLILLSPYIIKNVAMIATSPLRVKKHQDLRNPNLRKQEIDEAKTNLGVTAREDAKIKQLESILLNPNLSPTLREQVRGQIERLKGKK